LEALLAECTDDEKAGITFHFIRFADELIPLLMEQDPIMEFPRWEPCESSDDEDVVEDTVFDAQGVEIDYARKMDSEQGSRTGGGGDADTNNQAGPAEG
jgi:hypothetical protein